MKTEEIFVPERYAIAITSMTRIGNKIYLGLTGGANTLAAYDLDNETITVLPPVFPWIKERGYCTKIHNAMGILSDGSIVCGEGNHFTWDGIPVTVPYFEKELPESMLARKWKQGFPDVKYTDFCLENLNGWNRRISDPGAKIVRYFPQDNHSEVIAKLPELFYVQSMIVDSKRDRGFGHTLPDNHFFYIDFSSCEVTDFGHISDFAHHNMVITPDGICYGGWLDKANNMLKLLKFDPDRQRLEYLDKQILPDIGPKIAGNQGIDQWIVTRSSRIFMGTVDRGMLFEFDPVKESFRLIKTLSPNCGRTVTMDEDEHGTIWIGTGYPHMRLVQFEPDTETCIDHGVVNARYERCYFHASCIAGNHLFLGETDGFVPSLHIVNLRELRECRKATIIGN